IADSLNHSSLKKRITMMTKNQSKSSTRLCSLAFVPAMALAFVLSNSFCVKAAQQEVTAAEQVKQAVETVDDNSKGNTFEADEMVVVAYGDGKEKEAKKVPEVVKPPKYVGGEAAMYKKLADVINFVGDMNETGRVIVGFTINAEGKMVNPHIIKGLSEAKNNEAIRAVKQLTDWEPALTKDGKKVACDYTLPITFKTAPVRK
ncbi:MAG: energy transducer TonB, partial [Muribaculaceae bacterium]|nr:energy transducer TonB [Muribaculaceae bacterium]